MTVARGDLTRPSLRTSATMASSFTLVFPTQLDERIAADKPKSLSPWIVGLVVFGGKDPETGLIVVSAFQRRFSHEQNVKAWEKVGAVPLSRRCLSSPKVRRSIGDGTDNQQALVYLIVEHNTIACNALTLEGFNGDVMKVMLKPV